MSFATLDDYLVYYPTTDSVVRAQAARAVAAACADISRYCSQTFSLVTGDEITLHGNGRSVVLLPELPVVAVNSVFIDKGLASEVEVTDFRVDSASGDLYRPAPTAWDTTCYWSGRWPVGFSNVTVDYDHGYANVPEDLIRAAVTIAHSTVTAPPVGIASETIGGYSYTTTGTTDPVTVQSFRGMLDGYKLPRIPVA